MTAAAIFAVAAGAAGPAQAMTVPPAAAHPRPALASIRLTPLRVPRAAGYVPALLRRAAGTFQCYGADSLRAQANLLWVSPELGYSGSDYGMLRATAGSVGGPLQQFTLCHNSGGYWVFYSDDNNDRGHMAL